MKEEIDREPLKTSGGISQAIKDLGYANDTQWQTIYNLGGGSDEFRDLYEQLLQARGADDFYESEGLLETQSEMALLTEQMTTIEEIMSRLAQNKVETMLNLDININPNVSEVSVEGKENLGELIGMIFDENAGEIQETILSKVEELLDAQGVSN